MDKGSTIVADIIIIIIIIIHHPPPSSKQHLSYGDCLEDKREDYQNFSLLLCLHRVTEKNWTLCCFIISLLWQLQIA